MSTIKFTVEMGQSEGFPGSYWLNVDNERPEYQEYVDGMGGISEGFESDPYQLADCLAWLMPNVVKRQIEAAFGVKPPQP